jgi:hypothetical protein
MSNVGPTDPKDVNQGFPNPMSDDYQGTRTPAEQFEYEQQKAARDAAAGTTATPAEAPEGLPSNQA